MITRQLHSADEIELAEAQFYAFYDWCLNPFLTAPDLLERLREEMERYERLQPGWQRQECKVNLYLFVCAIAFIVDDYLAWRPWTLSSIADHFPRLRFAVRLARWCLDIPRSLQSLLLDRAVVRWRGRWGNCVDRVCEILVSESESVEEQWSNLKAALREVSSIKLPKRILSRRMRIPEGYRDQDLTHHDALFMVQKFLASQSNLDREAEYCVIGVRTAGAYFAPVAKAYLSATGCSRVSWMTIRPKDELSRWEQHGLRALARHRSVRALLIDDHPNTGATFLRLCELLEQAGMSPKQDHHPGPASPRAPQLDTARAGRTRACSTGCEHYRVGD